MEFTLVELKDYSNDNRSKFEPLEMWKRELECAGGINAIGFLLNFIQLDSKNVLRIFFI